jgi:hypothetical protein
MLGFAVLCHSALYEEGMEAGTYIYMPQLINMQR